MVVSTIFRSKNNSRGTIAQRLLHIHQITFHQGAVILDAIRQGQPFFFFLHPREGSICHFLLNFLLLERGQHLPFPLERSPQREKVKDTICIYCLLEAGDIVMVCFVAYSFHIVAPVADPGFLIGGAVDLSFCQCARLIVRLKDTICIISGDIVMHIVKNVSTFLHFLFPKLFQAPDGSSWSTLDHLSIVCIIFTPFMLT